MGEITKIAKSTSKSQSLRTTIPSGIVKQFNLKKGDMLSWEIIIYKGELAILVRPIKTIGDENGK